jgi:hypothetical protein
MQRPHYPYKKNIETRYTFISRGRKIIEKIVEFSPTSIPGIYNMGFGDLLPDGTIDDTVNSNNGDIIEVMATIIHILKEFTLSHRQSKIYFIGSTPERTALYRRILKTYYQAFSNEFFISALIKKNGQYHEVIFKTTSEEEYYAFLIKRK